MKKPSLTTNPYRLLGWLRALSTGAQAAASLAALCALAAALWWVWSWGDSRPQEIVADAARSAIEERAGAPLFERGEAPVVRRDSAGALTIERVPVRDVDELVGAVSLDRISEGQILFIRRRNVFFPEFRSPGAGVEVEVVCLPGPCADTTSVIFTPHPRPLLEWDPKPAIGAGVLPRQEMAQTFWVGADLIRIGPAHAGAYVVHTPLGPGNLTGLPVDFAPGVSAQLKANLYLTGGVTVVGDQLYLGVTAAL